MRLLPLLALLACKDAPPADSAAPLPGVGALGHQTHALASVNMDIFGEAGDGLNVPRDLAFNPEVEGELWVVNRADDSTTTFFNAGTIEQTSTHIIDPFALHFMEEVSSIAFGQPQHFGTCQESRNSYNDQYQPNNFMGPTLWSSDLAIYGESNPEAVAYLTELFGFYTDLGSHLDMLHESPLCMGIAWESDNVYWVFDGFHDAIVRYDFQVDHGPGYDDHSDGVIGRYAEGEVSRVADVPSHMELDRSTGLLYIADTGNNRVAVLDTASGQRGRDLRTMEPGTDHYLMEGADISTLIDGAAVDPPMQRPSGLALIDGHLLVGDNATGVIYAFDLQGNPIDHLPTGLPDGALMGLEPRSLDELWIVDAVDDRVLRLTPKR